MPLAAGTRLGPHEITALLGAGGMGEVYRAHDTQLKRDVALKILPADLSIDPERLARFQREAELLAALNHPHIAQIHGLAEAAPAGGDVGGGARGATRALVMELVEGPTLADRIAQGAVPVAEALPLARQLAEALEYAHEHGVIHRDLKPANVKLTSDGDVKVLDFGLAKALVSEAASETPGDSPTMRSPAMTQAGLILGTAAYMSPEQARGAVVDKRADIWAFGVVLFELLSGRPCFAGETVTDVLAAVVRAEPDWTALPADTPPRVGELLRRCLAKDRRQRLRDVGDARLEIEAALGTASDGGSVSIAAATDLGGGARMSGREKVAWLSTALALLLAVAAFTLPVSRELTTGRASAPRPLTFTITLPPGVTLYSPNTPAVAVSPEGTRLVIAATDGSRVRLYSRALDDLELRPIPGSEGASMPFLSPDGTWIGFVADTLLRKVPLNGGTPTTICFGGDVRGASWGADGWIVFTRAMRSGLWRVRADGGEPEEVTTLDRAKEEKTHRLPHVLPDGKGVLFASATGDMESYDDSTIVARRPGTGGPFAVLRGGMAPQYVESGHIVFARAGAIFVVPFDIDRLAVTGQTAKVISGVRTNPSTGSAEFSVSANGTLAYVGGGPVGQDGRVIVVDREGSERPLLDAHGPYIFVRLSPDGRALAVEQTKANEELWVYDLDRGSAVRFASGWDNMWPVWTPDGQQLVFSSNRLDLDQLFVAPVDGRAAARALTGGKEHEFPLDVSADGRTLVYQQIPGRRELWRLSLAGEANPQPVLRGSADYWDARLSPDGRWLAYESDESGRAEIYVRPFPGPGGRHLISAGGGHSPRWTRGGREIVYEAPDGTLMSVATTLAPAFQASRPRPVWKGPRRAFMAYDVSADGERFVFSVPGPSSDPPREVTVVTNWLEELKRLAPPGR